MLPEVEADGRLREADVKRITDYYAREQSGISWKWQAMDSKHCAAPLGGQKTGNNPTDRGKLGAKINLLVDGRGAPISIVLTAANRHDKVSYQVRIDRFAFSCCLRPPVVAGVRAYELALVQQSYATIHERLLHLLDLLEVAVCYPFVAQRPQPF